ncbi:hypothetical protein A8C56_05105 [Niabella ginsenosidivorans]|uniref:Methyltransferase FkbM domain-containing protein n=1 Tax=Niabella ginsenosidivorans TaxID=1176587 RepID=A0A1A9I171_9BACT|nr:FkbM family methyltransferase [Niabella ginsenosidivorans]ANH80451.1 hypothetical protein A8C56_05105 [Niabella ginsenosidivorans]
MKKILQSFLQKILGYENYLFYFSRAKISFFKGQAFEPEFFEFMNLIPAGTILDVGANIGITTIPFAQKFPKERIHAFEPIPSNCNALERIVKFYKVNNAQLHKIALGEENGILKLVTPIIKGVRMQGLSHAYVEELQDDWNTGDICEIPMSKLDDVSVLQTEKKIVAIKIDVENFEYHVLKGARQILLQHKPVIYCELWPNENRNIVIDFLKELGYSVKVFEGSQLIDFTDQKKTNFIFTPKTT